MKEDKQTSIIDKFHAALAKEHPDIAITKKDSNADNRKIGYDFKLTVPKRNLHFLVLHRKNGAVITESYDENNKIEQVTHTVIKNEVY